jgi:RimJ/RimL family protein N-acetyltransferase
VLAYGRRTLGLTRVLAIVQPDNPRSIGLLTRLGFVHTGEITMPGESAAVRTYASEP